MPLNSAQLAELVSRAKHKTSPVVSPPPQPPKAPSAASVTPAGPPTPVSMLQSEHAAEVEDFPTGWELRKESWHFHRRFYAIFKRAMRHGEYSQLLCQIRRGTAEHLWENCWRVTLPGSNRTLPVRATPWRLITILPRDWQPPSASSRLEAEA